MFKRPYLFILFIIVLLASALTLSAQGAPPQINAALTDLSTRVGQTVGLNDLDNWLWEQDSYPDVSLGCPQPDQAYAQVVTVGYKFTLTYKGVIYDYRVSADSQIIVLCSQSKAGEATATPIPQAGQGGYVPPCPNVEPDKAYMRIRLTAGIQGRVVPGLPNNVRAEPSITSGLLGEIPGGSIFTVLAGPQCADGLVWWQIDSDGFKGWTVEGRDNQYWVEPLPPIALPVTRTPISAQNVLQLSEVARLQGNLGAKVAFSADAKTLAVLGGAGSDGAWLYNLEKFGDTPRILASEGGGVLSLAYNPNGENVLVGGVDGAARLLKTGVNEPLVQTLFLQTHQSNVAAVAYAPDGKTFATAGLLALTTAQVDKSNAILVWNIDSVTQKAVLSGHSGRVNGLAYSPAGALVSVSDDQTLRVWDVNALTVTLTVQSSSPLLSVAWSPNGQFMATGAADGTVTLLDAASGKTIAALRGHAGAVNSLAFSADNTLLVSGGDDGTVIVWSSQSNQALITLKGHEGEVGGVALSPDGTLIASADRKHTVRLWVIGLSVG